MSVLIQVSAAAELVELSLCHVLSQDPVPEVVLEQLGRLEKESEELNGVYEGHLRTLAELDVRCTMHYSGVSVISPTLCAVGGDAREGRDDLAPSDGAGREGLRARGARRTHRGPREGSHRRCRSRVPVACTGCADVFCSCCGGRGP